MRFLDPEVIVHKVSKLVIEEIDRIVKKKIELEEGRKRLNQIILQLGDIGFRSVDRKDSRTAICTIQALCFALDIYYEQKKLISNDFFRVEVNEFPNLSKGGCLFFFLLSFSFLHSIFLLFIIINLAKLLLLLLFLLLLLLLLFIHSYFFNIKE